MGGGLEVCYNFVLLFFFFIVSETMKGSRRNFPNVLLNLLFEFNFRN